MTRIKTFCGEDDAPEVGDGVFVIAAGDARPLLQAPEAGFDGVAFVVQVSPSYPRGRHEGA